MDPVRRTLDLRAFNHCHCSPNCVTKIPVELVASRIKAVDLCKTQDEVTVLVAGFISDQASIFGDHHITYHVNEFEVCLEAFCDIHLIGHGKIAAIREQLHLLAKERFQQLRARHEQEQDEKKKKKESESVRLTKQPSRMTQDEIVAWILIWISKKRLYVDENGKSCIVDDFSWNEVYHEFASTLTFPPSLTTFYRAKDYALEHEKVHLFRPQDHPICDTCVVFQERLRGVNTGEEVLFLLKSLRSDSNTMPLGGDQYFERKRPAS
jgi:hypothetical protein